MFQHYFISLPWPQDNTYGITGYTIDIHDPTTDTQSFLYNSYLLQICCLMILTQDLYNKILLLIYTILYSFVKPNGIPSRCNTSMNFICTYEYLRS